MNKKNLIRILIAVLLTAAAFLLPEKYQIILFIAAYIAVGLDVVLTGIRNLFSGMVFDENLLMTISTVAAFCIGENIEAVAIMLFYQIGELFQQYAVHRSRNSVAELMNICPETVTVLHDGAPTTVDPESVEVGETFLVRPGERIALDGTVVEGEGNINTASISGESLPVTVTPGSSVISGSINLDTALQIRAEKTYENSTVSKILELVEDAAANKAPTERFITRFARYYTPAVVLLAVCIAVIPTLKLGGFSTWLYRAIIFLVVSCPCALVVSVPLAFFSGIGAACRRGILIKGSDYIEKLTKVNAAAFDKTGTLTEGKFEVRAMHSVALDEAELARVIAAAESLSSHPIAAAFSNIPFDPAEYAVTDYTEVGGKGIRLQINEKSYLVGKREWLQQQGVKIPEQSAEFTGVYAAREGEYLGCAELEDEIKPEATETMRRLRKLGIKPYMLTGDNEGAAASVARRLEISDYKSGMLPQDKAAYIKTLGQNAVTMFVGDGINDAPVLMCADVGVSMGSLGSDSAIEASDMVIMNDDLSRLPDAVALSKRIVRKVKQNIWFSLVVKVLVMILGAFGFVNAPVAVFADVGVMVIAVLNSLLLLRKS